MYLQDQCETFWAQANRLSAIKNTKARATEKFLYDVIPTANILSYVFQMLTKKNFLVKGNTQISIVMYSGISKLDVNFVVE